MKTDYTKADLEDSDRALLDYARKLTLTPAEMSPDDVNTLRDQGFSDAAISDACQVVSYFNYINRIADGLGVDLEPEMPEA